MKTTTIPSSVLGGQGSIGSFSLSVPNAAPSVGPEAGVDAVLAPVVAGAEAGAKMPTDYPMAGGSSTSNSQYSTIGPVPEG